PRPHLGGRTGGPGGGSLGSVRGPRAGGPILTAGAAPRDSKENPASHSATSARSGSQAAPPPKCPAPLPRSPPLGGPQHGAGRRPRARRDRRLRAPRAVFDRYNIV